MRGEAHACGKGGVGERVRVLFWAICCPESDTPACVASEIEVKADVLRFAKPAEPAFGTGRAFCPPAHVSICCLQKFTG